MRNTTISLPHIVVIERGAKKTAVQVCRQLNAGTKCAFFCDTTVMQLVGSEVLADLKKDFYVEHFNPASINLNDVKKLVALVKPFDFAIAVGGGRTIDAAKCASFLAGKPWVSFPTIPSHDGIVSSRASLEDHAKRVSVTASEPAGIIADLDILTKAPYRFIAAGAGDCLAKLSSVEDWRLADKAGKEKYYTLIGELSLLTAKAVMQHASEIKEKQPEGIEALVWSLIVSGFAMNIYGSSRPSSGSEHNFSHALDELGTKALHGEQVALGSIATIYLQGGDWRSFRNSLREIGLPTTAKEIGIEPALLIKALASAKDVRERYTVLNEKKIDEKEAEKVLREVGII